MKYTWLREAKDGLCLSIKVQPRASRNAIMGMLGDELKISVTAPPVDSAANAAVIEFMAEQLGISRSDVELVRGGASRHKKLFIRGLSAEQAAEKLGFE